MEMSNVEEEKIIDMFPIRGIKAKMFLPDRNVDCDQSNSIIDIYNTHRELDAIMSYIPDHPYVVDVGGHVGSTVLWWIQRVFARKITVFEPCNHSYRILKKNIELNDLEDSVEAVNACVGAMDGRAIQTFHSVQHTSLAKFAPYEGDGSDCVPMVSLDTFFYDKDRVDVLKIDVEGSELDVLQGGEKLITRDKPLIFIEIWDPFNKHQNPDIATSRNNWYATVEKLKELGYVRWKDVKGNNYLYVPKEKAWEYDNILHPETPKTYNEKIRYIARHGYDPLMTRLADKYRVREWVVDKIGEKYLTPLYGAWYSADDIDFNSLPSSFVLKTNHGCGYNIFVKDKSTANIGDIRKKIKGWLSENYAYKLCELQYRDIKRVVFAEEYMAIDKGSQLYNYNFHCFKGKCSYIGVTTKTQDARHAVQQVFMGHDWVQMPFRNAEYPLPKNTPERPGNLDDMIRVAETLAEGFEFVRVDLYSLGDKGIRFGEMTFTPTAGHAKIEPEKYNLEIGNMFDCTPDNRIHGQVEYGH
jgi:FkbM family methyltransferase